MSKFTSYDAPVQVGGPVNIPQASAADFGGQIGAAIETSGALLSDAVAKHKVRQDKRDVVSAHAQLSDFKLQRTRAAGEAMRNAGTGAPYVFDEQVAEFDEAFGTFTENMTDIQRQAIAATADTFRYSTLKTVSDFQAAEIVKADLGNMRAIALGIGSELHAGQRDMVSAEADFRRILDVSNLSDPGKEALMLEQLPIWRANLANGLLENPLEGSRALAAGELEGVLTDDEMTKFEDDLFKRLNGMETEALNKQLFEFAAYHPQALDAVVSGEITTLEGLEGLRPKISDELYKHLFQIVRDRVIPDRTEAEIADNESNVLSDYNAMSIKRKKGKMTTSASLEEILRFQNNLGGLVAEGYISSTSARYYMRRTEEAAQMLMDKAGATSDLKNKAGRLWNISVFDRGAQAINEMAEDEGWDAGKRSRVFREYIELHEEFDKIPDADRSVKEAAGNNLVVTAIDNALRTQNPAFSHFDDMPDGIMTASGQILMATGSGAQRLKPTVKTLPFERVLHKKDATGKDVFWYNILDEFNRPIPGQHVEVFKAIGVNDEVDAFVDEDGFYLVQPNGKIPDESTQPAPESNASIFQSTEPVAGSVTVTSLADNPDFDTQDKYGINSKNVVPDDLLWPGVSPGTQLFQDATGAYYYREPGDPQRRVGLPQDRAREIKKGMNLNGPLPLDPYVYGTDDAGAALEEKNKAQVADGSGPFSSANAASNTAPLPDPAKPDVKPVAASSSTIKRNIAKGYLKADGTAKPNPPPKAIREGHKIYNNPGNGQDTEDWAGSDGTTYGNKRALTEGLSPFTVFTTKIMGLRSMAMDLRTKLKGGITAAQLVKVWAPRGDNNPNQAQYIKTVQAAVVSAQDKTGSGVLTVAQIPKIMAAIIKSENPTPVQKYYLDDPKDLIEAIALSAIQLPKGTTLEEARKKLRSVNG